MYPTVKQVKQLGITVAINDRMDRRGHSGWSIYPDEIVLGFAWRERSLSPSFKDDVQVDIKILETGVVHTVSNGDIDWKTGNVKHLGKFAYYRPSMSNWSVILCPVQILTKDQRRKVQRCPVLTSVS
ncbi:hypothetical protein A6E01_20505 (plasmid) [Vibrio breoganii]|uniref:Uncharacterized protein n=1 Tax=Vibrio breoganii TaxID=553239 RepID=A0AAN0Y007_9VIBR|nr:hypothetical protein [Vibrio breoganii]ANO35597.1 hypothetical protein A6E01_20505 [Vibrio breoganii]